MPASLPSSAHCLCRILIWLALSCAMLAGSVAAAGISGTTGVHGIRTEAAGYLQVSSAGSTETTAPVEDRMPDPERAQDEPDVGKRRRGSHDLLPAHSTDPGIGDSQSILFPASIAILPSSQNPQALHAAHERHPVLVSRLNVCRGRAPPIRA